MAEILGSYEKNNISGVGLNQSRSGFATARDVPASQAESFMNVLFKPNLDATRSPNTKALDESTLSNYMQLPVE